MKIISLHSKQELLLKKVKENNKEAQLELFCLFSPKMLGVCRQYVKDTHHAEDLMLQGFFKVFTNINKYKQEGSFEGWIRKIMVNTCISYLRKKTVEVVSDKEFVFDNVAIESLENTSVEDIQVLIDGLPSGYKMVFNLYAIEGYKHKEIAEMLQISINTSKSQLFKARKMLQDNYCKMNKTIHDNGSIR